MLNNFLTVGCQVLILFILIFTGFLASKTKIINDVTVSSLSKLVLYFVTPCVIVNSFNMPFDSLEFTKLLISFAAAVFVHFLNIFLAHAFIHDKNRRKEKVYRFGIVFSNCGYMALPLQMSLLGTKGVFYASGFIAVFNIFTWTYGAFMMDNNEKKRISLKKIFLNPGILGVFTGILLFMSPYELPLVLESPIKSLAALNTPIPMIIIGFYLANIANPKNFINKNLFLATFLRLIACPLICFFVFRLFNISGILLTSLVICASTPAAANTIMFATMFENDTDAASSFITFSTILSILTMSVIVAFAM